MNRIQRAITGSVTLITALVFVMTQLLAGCGTREEEPDCVTDPNAKPVVIEKKVETFGLGKVGDKEKRNNDWCRACVMSRANFASCQRVYADAPGDVEDKAPLKKKALDKACADAGYKTGECPDSALISMMCKGEKPPEGTKGAAEAVQDLFQKLNPAPPSVAVPDKGAKVPDVEAGGGAAEKKDQPPAPIIE